MPTMGTLQLETKLWHILLIPNNGCKVSCKKDIISSNLRFMLDMQHFSLAWCFQIFHSRYFKAKVRSEAMPRTPPILANLNRQSFYKQTWWFLLKGAFLISKWAFPDQHYLIKLFNDNGSLVSLFPPPQAAIFPVTNNQLSAPKSNNTSKKVDERTLPLYTWKNYITDGLMGGGGGGVGHGPPCLLRYVLT